MTKDDYIRDEENDSSYSRFLEENTKIINHVLNRLLWFSALGGPAIALFVWFRIHWSFS